jgi:hypothetical protein
LTDAIRQSSPAAPTAQIQDVETCEQGPTSPAVGNGAIIVNNNATAGYSSDTLELVFASGGVVTTLLTPAAGYGPGVTTIGVVDASQFSPGDKVLISNTAQGHTVTVASVNTGGNTLTLNAQACGTISWPATGTYLPGSYVIRVVRAQFYIGTVDGIPTLMMLPGGPLAGAVAQPLAEGVEDLQVALAGDANGNGVIDPGEWVYDGVTPGPPSGPIIAVKLVLVARATTSVTGGVPYLRPAALDHAAASTFDTYRRRVLQATIELRNMGGSP